MLNSRKPSSTRERAESPVADAPEAKRARQEESGTVAQTEIVPDESSAAEPTTSIAESAPAAEADVDLSSLPADILGSNPLRPPPDFKEEPFIYLSPEDEQVKLIMWVRYVPN